MCPVRTYVPGAHLSEVAALCREPNHRAPLLSLLWNPLSACWWRPRSKLRDQNPCAGTYASSRYAFLINVANTRSDKLLNPSTKNMCVTGDILQHQKDATIFALETFSHVDLMYVSVNSSTRSAIRYAAREPSFATPTHVPDGSSKFGHQSRDYVACRNLASVRSHKIASSILLTRLKFSKTRTFMI